MVEHGTGNEGGPVTDREEAVLRQFRKALSSSGGGGGVSLHFDADIARELRLDPNTQVHVDVLEEDGDVTMKIRGIPAGFTEAAFQEYAEEHGWKETDAFRDGDRWSHTYRDSTGLVRVEMDSQTRIDGAVVNNVFVQSDPIEVDADLERYKNLCMAAIGKDLRVRVRDSDGLWQRLRSSHGHETDDAPDRETFQQLLNATDRVSVQLVKEMPSLRTTLTDIGEAVDSIRTIMLEYVTDVETPSENPDPSG